MVSPLLFPSGLPFRAGMGLRAPHYREVLETSPNLAWVEVHSENFFEGGAALNTLLRVRAERPVSLHGVGMGLGSLDPLDPNHLSALKRLVERVEPAAVSEHLCWNQCHGDVFNDLLPFPMSTQALQRLGDKIDQVQNRLGCPLWIENLSYYVNFPQDDWGEGEFLNELCRRTGCGVLLDVNNLYVNYLNFGVNPDSVLQTLHAGYVKEYHLAGYSQQGEGWVDTHSAPVAPVVWEWFGRTLRIMGPRPTLIEWDNDIPALTRLMEEVAQAQACLDREMSSARASLPDYREVAEVARLTGSPRTVDGRLDLAERETFQWFSNSLSGISGSSEAAPAVEGSQHQRWGLAVYRNNLRENLLSALQGAYPVLFQLVGEQCFRSLAERYRRTHPSRHGNLHEYGEQFPEFVGQDAIAREWPWFESMARLEWVCHRSYFAKDSPVLDSNRLAAVNSRNYADLCFMADAAIRLVKLDYTVLSIWEAHQSSFVNDGGLEWRLAPECILVTRQQGKIIPQRLTEWEAQWWECLLTGHTTGEVLAIMASHYPHQAVDELWVTALRQGWLVDFTLGGKEGEVWPQERLL